ncbi:ABC transporter permease [Aquibium sp. A9E412]|uniref:ABC transporter permease n=1 Tax=Aquibium sp. A9E412 TaxID=2976767 RepID=UPI0025B041B4|nr:ABC transporter permease [Aquibium sp. A9E412]MDN2567027.1 ABC transporter permease [Aquibium sp. A9E412]
MLRFLVRRFLSAAVVVFGVVTVIFVLARLLGDPVALMIQPGMTDADVAALRSELGLDRPLLTQYVAFLGDAVRGDFGVSPWQHRPALELVLDRLPATLLLTVAAMVFALVIALVVGSVSAMWRGSLTDRAAMFMVLLGQSVPNFWLGLMLVLVFATWLGVLPTVGSGTWQHLILPTITLGFFSLARLTRLVRSELLSVVSRDYIRTARAKGLPQPLIFRRHALRNIAIPVITVLAVDFGLLMGGAVVTETIFAWPGVGRLMIQAIGQRDFPILQAGVFVIALLVVAANLIADLAYAWFDPQVSYG